MPDVLELSPFDMPGLHRQARRRTLQRLNTGHLIDRNGLHTLFRGAGGDLIHRTDIGALGVKVGIRLGRQPIAATVRLEIGFFFKTARQSRARCFSRCRGPPIGGPVRFGSND
jgi:hypothetical protein